MSTDVTLEALLPTSRAPAGARCATHADREALGICARCGSFVCRAETIVYDRQAWCPKCCELPDVEWLEVFRRQLALKFAPGAVVVIVASAAQLIACSLVLRWTLSAPLSNQALICVALIVLATLTNVAAAIAYANRWRPARFVPPAAWAIFAGAFMTLYVQPGALDLFAAESVAPAIAVGLVTALVVHTVSTSARGLVFFGLPVSRRQLLLEYWANFNNPDVQLAVLLGVFGCGLPIVGLFAFVFAERGRRKVDALSNPPIRGDDVRLGFVLGAVNIAVTGAWVLYFR